MIPSGEITYCTPSRFCSLASYPIFSYNKGCQGLFFHHGGRLENIDWSALCLRWAHYIFSGIWIGQIYFTLFILGPALAGFDSETRKKVGASLGATLGMLGILGATLSVVTGAMMFSQIYTGTQGLGIAGGRGAWLSAGIVSSLLMWFVGMIVILPGSNALARATIELPKVVKRVRIASLANAFLSLATLFLMILAAGHPAVIPFSYGILAAVAGLSAAAFGILFSVAARFNKPSTS